MIFHDVIQNSEAWFELRSKKATTSNFGKILANYGKPFGDPAKDYAHKIALEQIKGGRLEEESFSNKWTEQGHENEPIAKDLYEKKRELDFIKVSNGGFCESEKFKFVGGSPDGLILVDNGGIEIKSVGRKSHKKVLQRNSFDPQYKWQLLGNLWLCELDYIDFISYCPSYPKVNQLFIHRLYADAYQPEFRMIENRLSEFAPLIEAEKKLALAL